MAKFMVLIPIAGSFAIEVEAADEKAAKAAAWDEMNAYTGDVEAIGQLEWEFLEKICSGNVCHAPHWEVTADPL